MVVSRIQLAILIIGAFSLPALAADRDCTQDLLLLHGKILTVDKGDRKAEALAIRELISTAGMAIEKAALIGALFQLGWHDWSAGCELVHGSVQHPSLDCFVVPVRGAMLLLIALSPATVTGLIITVFMAGFFTSGSQSSMPPLAASFYPTIGRATGVSWMLGIGRFGAILGAFMGGVLLSIGWDFHLIIGALASYNRFNCTVFEDATI